MSPIALRLSGSFARSLLLTLLFRFAGTFFTLTTYVHSKDVTFVGSTADLEPFTCSLVTRTSPLTFDRRRAPGTFEL